MDRRCFARARSSAEWAPTQSSAQPLAGCPRNADGCAMSDRSRPTERLTATQSDIARAAGILRAGGTVAFPTETVYGLGANALDANAVARIFTAKERPSWDPIIVHVSDRAMLDRVAIVPPQAERLIAAFWPGPLTLLLPRTPQVPDTVTAGRPLV